MTPTILTFARLSVLEAFWIVGFATVMLAHLMVLAFDLLRLLVLQIRRTF